MMRFSKLSSLEEFISAAVLYSMLFTSKCQADKIPGYLWQHDDEEDFVREFKTDIPWTPMDLQKRRQDFTLVAWIAVITVVIIIAIIVCACCIIWKILPKFYTRRQSSNVALVPPRTNNSRTFSRLDPRVDRGRRDSSIADSTYNPGVMNFAFTRDLPDPLVGVQEQERPPAYIDVVSQTAPYDEIRNTFYPEVRETKFVETPPPTYVTVAPFQ